VNRVDPELVRNVVERVLEELQAGGAPGRIRQGSGDGVFDSPTEAVEAAAAVQPQWARTNRRERGRVIAALRAAMHRHAEEFARLACQETGMGRFEDKVRKHHIAADFTPGLEDLEPRCFTGDRGLVLEEYAPYGVVAAVTPSTHPIPVMLNSLILTLAPGNAVVFSVHPAAKNVSARALEIFHNAMTAAGAPPQLVCMIREPSLEAVNELFRHPKIALIAATGGPALVEAAFQSGKKVIAAGPGNPPVLVDETADLEQAARCIVEGASFDNNILCIAEKEAFVVETVFEAFCRAMERGGAIRLDRQQIDALTQRVFVREEGGWKIQRGFVGKNASVLADAAGLPSVGDDVRLLFGETPFEHPFVQEEQMMPFLPVVRVPDFDAGLTLAVAAEHDFGHTAMIHSHRLERITRFARTIDTSIVVVNGSSLAGNGPPAGEGTFSHTIASPTGEGVCTPRRFARIRRLAVTGTLHFGA